MRPIPPRRLLSALVLAIVGIAAACQAGLPGSSPAVPMATPDVAPPEPARGTDGSTAATPAPPPLAARTVPPAAPSLTPTPGADAAAQFLPASTPFEPEVAATLNQARVALAGADYPGALTRLAPLADSLSGDQAAEVHLLQAQAMLGDQQFTAALQTADALLTATQRKDLQSAARLVRGQALRGLRRWDDAATDLRAVAETNPLVAPAVRLELEDMWLAAGQADQAAADGQKGLDAAQARLLKINLAEKLASADVQLNRTDAAMDAYRQLLTAAGTKGYLGEQLYNLAVGTSQLGHTDEAINALRTAISDFPRARTAPDAADLLDKLGGMRAEDRFYAGVIRYWFWQFRAARDDFDAYLAALPDGDRAVEARYYRGLSSPAAETTSRLVQLAHDVPDDDIAPMALLEAGKAQEELGDYASAEAIYDGLVGQYPTRDAGHAGAFRRGLARLMQNDANGALRDWSDLLARDPSPSVRAQALYWTAKVLSQAGDVSGAQHTLEAAAAVRPVDYYVMRSKVALDPPPASTNFDASRVAPADEAEVARWFASNGLDLTAAAQTASADPAYIRATALVQHGLFRAANWEHEVFLTTYADKPDRLYWLAARFGEMGLPNAQLKLGLAALNAATAEGQVSILDVPRALARVASPLAFADLETSIAQNRKLDPLLFLSLMRQESDFDPYAESVAKAKGLTQIIPQTGTEIANALGVADFQQTDLFGPKENLQFGSYYFAQRLRRNGSVDRALAAYNAGDGNVDTWDLPGRDDPDIFVEYVPFPETHDYVKAILTYWWENRYIWAA